MHHLRKSSISAILALVLALAILVSTLVAVADVRLPASAPLRVLLRRSHASLTRADTNTNTDPDTDAAASLPDPGPITAGNLRRGPGGPWLYGPYTYYCGIFNTGMPQQIRTGSFNMRIVNLTYTVPPRACRRVYCYDTSAVYVCNDHAAHRLAVPGDDVGWMADRLALLCCDSHHATSAQLFHPTQPWNVVVGYGNCRHDPAEPPSSFGTTNGGVNGECIPNETRPSPGDAS